MIVHPLTKASEALLADVIESLDEARRELGVWVDRDRAHNPGWTEVGYEPWANKPSLALWDVEADGLSRGLYQRLRAIEDAARAPLLDVIEGLLAQHAGWAETDPPGLSADHLSANERAFEALGWDDPHPMPDLACDEPGCLRRADCGWPSDAGYRWTCGGHMRAGDRP